ncbi:hypothetical protein BDV06DRAFT_125175 [Aspergillus oleicola]
MGVEDWTVPRLSFLLQFVLVLLIDCAGFSAYCLYFVRRYFSALPCHALPYFVSNAFWILSYLGCLSLPVCRLYSRYFFALLKVISRSKIKSNAFRVH